MTHLVWLHRDLRLADQPALFHASKESSRGVIALYQACPEEWRDHGDAPVKVDFWLRNLASLSKDLAATNIALLFRPVTKGDIVADLLGVARTHGVTDLHFNNEYELNEAARNERVRREFERAGMRVHAYDDQTLIPPGEVRTGEGKFYTVFTPFKRACVKLLVERGIEVLPKPRRQAEMVGVPDAIPGSVAGFENSVDPAHWPPGESSAHRRLGGFLDGRIRRYKDDRDTPSIDGTSALSPYLGAGVISARGCVVRAVEFNKGRFDGESDGASHWISELLWRDFYRQVLVGFPRVCRGRAFKPATDRIRWNDDDAAFRAWCEGRTGVPIVDAAMRQLKSTGWMHNRLRMVAAMFLTKDMFIDWRRGESHFMRHLVDGDFASNNGGWQWSASTGTDAAPYFRIFNPYSQSKKCDPDGAFIREWVPELGGLEAKDIHDPSALPGLIRSTLDYPDPIVDRASARERVMMAFQGLA